MLSYWCTSLTNRIKGSNKWKSYVFNEDCQTTFRRLKAFWSLMQLKGNYSGRWRSMECPGNQLTGLVFGPAKPTTAPSPLTLVARLPFHWYEHYQAETAV